ncbi:MAG: Ribonuclease HII [Candidatus Methanofastidiosum methylothiophilum]|uniref:Ribonuclease n=1 Tax=Candidatus Methanofastidiosum methylothiophilum TaxID=1705564 RepID=A0A150INM6_9EURY|nr:MAG: Ribonuclease HII [Candidatus Methanofastidiosum methylthiophilus]
MIEQTTNTIQKNLENNGFRVGDVQSINYGVQFSVSKGSYSRILRIYSSKKKGITIDASQLGNGEIADKIREIIGSPVESISSPASSLSQENLGYPLIGCDESGKGDYFGPLVTAAVIIDNENIAKNLKLIGVRDCKLLTDEQVLDIADKIANLLTHRGYQVETLLPEEYNQKYDEITNLNKLLAWLHASGIENLLEGLYGIVPTDIDLKKCYAKQTTLLVDQFSHKENTLKDELNTLGSCCKLIQQTHAESNVAVAAASILARSTFLIHMHEMSNDYKMRFPKGATDVISTGQKFVKAYGPDALKNVAKIHFKTTEQVVTFKND